MKKPKGIQLGAYMFDEVTLFKGVVIAKTEWLNGRETVLLQPKALQPNGQPVDAASFDVSRVMRYPEERAE